MTTIVNNPRNGESVDGGVGIIVGIVVLLAIVVVFFVYVLPMIRSDSAEPKDTIDVNVNLTEPVSPTPTPVSPTPAQ